MLDIDFPAQKKSDKAKDKKWREDCVRWLSNFSVLNSSPIRKNVVQMKRNCNLYAGILDMNDLAKVLNPTETDLSDEKIQHFPLLNKKLDLIQGEEFNYPFDHTFTVTNKNAISQKERDKKKKIDEMFQKLLADESMSDEEYQNNVERLGTYFKYEYQDIREMTANCVSEHYWKKYNVPMIFNSGMLDVLTNREEAYQVFIEHGAPMIQKLDIKKLHVLKSGFSNKIEDADMIIIEDFWQPGKIIDTFAEQLTDSQVKTIEEYNKKIWSRNDGRDEFLFSQDLANIPNPQWHIVGDEKFLQFADGVTANSLPYDMYGNIRVLRVYWKSLRMIKKITTYDPVTGEKVIKFRPQDYIADKDRGEDESKMWVNEAWHGVMIGSGEDAIILDAKPCEIQYNTINNPSKCHFGIIGSIYSVDDRMPLSMLETLKPYNYQYDVTWDRLNKLMARNLGKLAVLDWSKKPGELTSEYWVAFAKRYGVAIQNNFNEVEKGKQAGMLAGALQSPTTIDADNSEQIAFHLKLLSAIEEQTNNIVGITPQREGTVQNRETYNGVERSIAQSNNITNSIFMQHNDVKKRVWECFIDTAKYCMKGTNEEMEYTLPDSSKIMMKIDGDMFNENCYGICIDPTEDRTKFEQNIGMITQAGIQNDKLSMTAVMEIFSSSSPQEKRRVIEREEAMRRQQEQEARQQELQQQKAIEDMNLKIRQLELEMAERKSIRENETKILVAQINAGNTQEENDAMNENEQESFNRDKEKLKEKQYEFDKSQVLKQQKLELEREKLRQQNRSINNSKEKK